MRVALVLGVIGKILRLFSLAFLPPLALSLYNAYQTTGDYHAAIAFSVAAVATLIGGFVLSLAGLKDQNFRRAEALGVVAGSWLIIALFAAIPYVMFGMTSIDAFFESISGLTTTGATVLTDFNQSQSFFLWRSMTQWFGGLGVIALFVVILPQLGVAGRQIMFAESSDATTDVVSPSIRRSARNLWLLYLGLTVLEMLMLNMVGHMPIFDSICHGLTTMSAGGFSPNPESIAGYNSPSIEWILIGFMIISGMSFPLLYVGLRRRPAAIPRDGEFRFYLGTLLFAAIGVALVLSNGVFDLTSIRTGLFQSASLISSTGFASVDYAAAPWTDSARMFLLIAMLVGGCAGSAAGGPKAIRNLLSLKYMWSELTRTLHPRGVLPLRHRGKVIPNNAMRSILNLVLCYALTYLIVALLLVLFGSNFVTAFSASLACVGNIGPGFESVGPMGNFADLNSASKIILSIGMWMGRLELVTTLALLHPDVLRHLRWRGKFSRD
ncbi:MAG: TrkH family potassium uptake protein [Planctomycetes bacterium]|nr:TrkH family potassium uptake protein [Planctomycetota bacterium]